MTPISSVQQQPTLAKNLEEQVLHTIAQEKKSKSQKKKSSSLEKIIQLLGESIENWMLVGGRITQ